MKKIYLSILFFLNLLCGAYAQQFGTGNLVVVRVDGTNAANLNKTCPVFLDEYEIKGDGSLELKSSRPLPVTDDGTNKQFSLHSGTTRQSNEGYLTLSSDNKWLSLMGYGVAAGVTSANSTVASTVPRVIAMIDGNGAMDTRTVLTDVGLSSATTPIMSSISDDGNNIWLNGGDVTNTPARGGVVRFTTKGSTSSTKLIAGTSPGQVGQLLIFDGQLYASNAASGATSVVNKPISGLATTAPQTVAAITGLETNSALGNGFILFDTNPAIAGPDLLYLIGGTSSAQRYIRKYTYNGTAWTMLYQFRKGSSTTEIPYSNLTGKIISGKAVLYATSASTGTGGKIVRFEDEVTATANAVVITDMTTGQANQFLRGIAYAPEPSTKSDPTLAFSLGTSATKTFGDADFEIPAATTNSTGAVTYKTDPASSPVADVYQDAADGNKWKIKIKAAGTVNIIAQVAETSVHNAKTSDLQLLTVSKAAQVIAGFTGDLNATYGDADLTLSATGGNSGNPILFSTSDFAVAEIIDGNKVHIKKAGTVILRANQAGNANYLAAAQVTKQLVIAKAAVDVIADNQSRNQGSPNPAGTFHYGAFKNSETEAVVTGTPVLSFQADETSPAGTYDINVDVSGLSADSYTFNPVKGTLTIAAKQAQTLTLHNFPATATYGDHPIVFTVSSNTANAVTFNSSNPSVAIVEKNALDDWSVKIIGAGEATITASQAEDASYTAGNTSAQIVVAKAPLKVIAEDKSKLSGEQDPAFTARYETFVNGDDAAKLTGNLQFTTLADGSNFQIIPSGLTSDNYDLTFINGKLTVGSIAFAPMTKIYGDAPFDPEARSTSGTAVYTSSNPVVAMYNAVTGLMEIKGAGSTEITATFTTGATGKALLTVAKKAVTVTVNAQTRIYGQPNPSFTASYSGFAYQETETVVVTQPQISTTATTVSPVDAYAITARDAAAANYSFTYVTGVLTVTRAALTVKAEDKSKVYGQINPPLTLTYTGLAAQDHADALGLEPLINTTASETSVVNAYPITVTGPAATANYTVSYLPGMLNITPATLTITADDKSKVQGEPNPPLTAAYAGFVNGDDAAKLTAQPLISTTAVQASPAGEYEINVSGAASANYILAYAKGKLVVRPLQTITYGPLAAATYGDAALTLNATSNAGTNPVYTSANPAIAVIESNNRVRITGTGSVVIRATFPQTAIYPVTIAEQTLTVNKKAVAVAAENKSKVFGQANPALTAAYTGFVNNETSAVLLTQPVIATTATATSNVGVYPVSVTGAAAANYSFTYADGVLTVAPATRTLAFNPIANRVYGAADFDGGATLSSNETVTYTSSNANVATIVNGKIHLAGAGTATITAAAPANGNYSTTPVQSHDILVAKATQTITFAALPVLEKGTAYTATATASSGLPVSIALLDPSIATLNGMVLDPLHIGKTKVTAVQPGNENYLPATAVVRDLEITDPSGEPVQVYPALSPNGDGVNDFLVIEGIRNYPKNFVTIVNRNGIKVFEAINYDNDGVVFRGESNRGGELLPAGTYFCKVEYMVNDEVRKTFTKYIVIKYTK